MAEAIEITTALPPTPTLSGTPERTISTLQLVLTPLKTNIPNPPEVTESIREALEFSEKAHRGQFRKNALKTPYISHPMAVAEIVSEACVDYLKKANVLIDEGIQEQQQTEGIARIMRAQADDFAGQWYTCMVQAALLHDVVEDTETTLAEIGKAFGSLVSTIVNDVSDDRTLAPSKRKRAQIDHITKISRHAKLVKLADKLHNCTCTLDDAPPAWSVARCQGYFAWSKKITDQVRGRYPTIDTRLDAIYAGTFRHPIHGEHPCIPADKPLDQQVDEYLASMV